MLREFNINTNTEDMINITKEVQKVVKESNVKDGICLVYCPHTTAAITINENADPDVKSDMLLGLNNYILDNDAYKHMEGNTTAHIKSSLVGTSETLIIQNSSLIRGTWQGIYFMEFDGPRRRKFYVKIIQG